MVRADAAKIWVPILRSCTPIYNHHFPVWGLQQASSGPLSMYSVMKDYWDHTEKGGLACSLATWVSCIPAWSTHTSQAVLLESVCRAGALSKSWTQRSWRKQPNDTGLHRSRMTWAGPQPWDLGHMDQALSSSWGNTIPPLPPWTLGPPWAPARGGVTKASG